MNCSDKRFFLEFQRVERWITYIAIPFFSIMASLFLVDEPYHFTWRGMLYHTGISFVGVFMIWFSTRYISNYFRKNHNEWSTPMRITLQFIVSTFFSVSAVLFLQLISKAVRSFLFQLNYNDPFDLKNLILTVVLLTFLINTLFESLYLFCTLSEQIFEREQYKKESAEAKYQNLTSKLNPHFLFNSLNTLSTIVEEDAAKAVSCIQELATVYRYVLSSHMKTWIDLPSELNFTRSYCSLLKMRFEDNLKIEFNVCIEETHFYILPLTIQLLIENAVKHNEISNSHPLWISVICKDDLLIVINNRQQRTVIPSTTKVGLSTIRHRYQYLAEKEVVVECAEKTFSVSVPLVKSQPAVNSINENTGRE